MTRARRPLMHVCGLLAWACAAHGQEPAKVFHTLSPGLWPNQVAVVVNADDPASMRTGARYLKARAMPEANLVRVHIPGSPPRIGAAEFERLRQEIDAQIDNRIQALVLVWTTPYAVDCQSITAALTLGLEPGLCQQTCAPSRASPYFDSDSSRPHDDLALRPTMLLPSQPEALADQLIARGIASDQSEPFGSAYFLVTSEKARNSRARLFPPSGRFANPPLAVHTLVADAIQGKRDIMFYETGRARVDDLDTLGFLPGALADHLTSVGGDLLGTSQMSVLRWLEAGATATYGTVSEPCNYWQKFPDPRVLLKHYLRGETAIEAYWKSVAWPAQGLFVGEPLAAPYRR
jgi:uncharacterized protein (TIGR03790 family)